MPDRAIRTEQLTKRYGDVVALDHLDLEVTPGEVVGFLGPNGAGKTTAIRLLLGLNRPTEGKAEIFGLDCQKQPARVHRRLAYVAGEADLWPSLTKLGATGNGTQAVLGMCFLMLAVLTGFVAGGQVTAARAEESGGTLDHFLVRPISRWSWLGGRYLVALSVLVVAGLVAGTLTWLGAAVQHSGLSLPTLLGAGVNLVPPSMVILGVGILAFGVRPRSVTWVVYGLLGWSILVVIVGGIGACRTTALGCQCGHGRHRDHHRAVWSMGVPIPRSPGRMIAPAPLAGEGLSALLEPM